MKKIDFNKFTNKNYYEEMENGNISTNDAMKQLMFIENGQISPKDIS